MIRGPEYLPLADTQTVTDRLFIELPSLVEEFFRDQRTQALVQEGIRQFRWNVVRAEAYLKSHSAFPPILERELCQFEVGQKRAFLGSLFGWSNLGFPHGEELGEFLSGLAYDRTLAGSGRPSLRFSGWFSDKQRVEELVHGFCEAAQYPSLEAEILLGREGLSTAVDDFRYHREDSWNNPIYYYSVDGYRKNKGAITLATSIAQSFALKGIAQYFPEGSVIRADLGRFIRLTVCEIILTSPKVLPTVEELADLGITDTGKKWDRPHKPLHEMWNSGLWPVGPVQSGETGQVEKFAVYYSE